MLLRKLAVLAAAGVTLSGCGGGGAAPGSPPAPGTTTASTQVTHADPVALLPESGQVRAVIRPVVSPTRHDQVLNFDTLSASFGTGYVRARSLASGAAGLDVTGPHGSHLYVRVVVFRNLAAASSLWPSFQNSTRLGTVLQAPAGSPAAQHEASVQPYCHRRCRSYRYAFRDQNVLAYVELDGPRAAHTLADAAKIAGLTEARIKRTLS